jgi:hypothetical protein
VLAGEFADLGEKTADCSRLLPVEAAVAKNARNIASRRTLERVP